MAVAAKTSPLTEDQWKLVLSIENLMWKLARKWTPPSLCHNESFVQESYDVLFYAATQSAARFDPKLGYAFTTYFGGKVRHRVFNYWRGRKEIASINEPVFAGSKRTFADNIADPRGEDPICEADCLSPLRFLDSRERMIVEHWHGLAGREKLNRNQIGAVLGISGARAWQIYDAAIRKIRSRIIK